MIDPGAVLFRIRQLMTARHADVISRQNSLRARPEAGQVIAEPGVSRRGLVGWSAEDASLIGGADPGFGLTVHSISGADSGGALKVEAV
ncbi:hypothetical protein ACU4GG_08660 [Streptomyces nojiriensis]